MGALLFPGQGSQLVGMGSEFFKNFKLVKKIFNEADEKLNYSISKIILEGPADQLQLTKITQPAILTVSYSIFTILKEEFNFNLNKIKFFAGHSLGEYSALVCSGALAFSDALFLLHERGKAMQEAVPVGKGSMIAVIGVKIDEVNNLIKSIKDKTNVCEIANDNADGQVIISGDSDSIILFQKVLKENNIKSIPLKVSAPFHCSLMKPAAEKMSKKIENINFNKSKINIVNNVNACVEENSNKIKELLTNQIFSTVKWRESMIYISKEGITDFIEIGPGKVLTGMVKRTIKGSNCFSINSITDMKNINDKFK